MGVNSNCMGEEGSKGCTTKVKRGLLPNVYAKRKKERQGAILFFLKKAKATIYFTTKKKKRTQRTQS